MVLQTQGISKSYRNDKKSVQALSSTDLSVGKNEFVCLIGPNGCGKSTLLKIIAGILTPTSGKLKAPDSVAYLPQQSSLLPWRSVMANLMLPAILEGKADNKSVVLAKKLLKDFNLEEFGDFYPHALSGGMQQKVALIRATLSSPKLMLLDEPFSALDSITRTELQSWLMDFWQKDRPGVLCVTHDIRESIFLADTIYVMGERPGSIKEKISVDLPRPRLHSHLQSEKARKLETKLSNLLAARG